MKKQGGISPLKLMLLLIGVFVGLWLYPIKALRGDRAQVLELEEQITAQETARTEALTSSDASPFTAQEAATTQLNDWMAALPVLPVEAEQVPSDETVSAWLHERVPYADLLTLGASNGPAGVQITAGNTTVSAFETLDQQVASTVVTFAWTNLVSCDQARQLLAGLFAVHDDGTPDGTALQPWIAPGSMSAEMLCPGVLVADEPGSPDSDASQNVTLSTSYTFLYRFAVPCLSVDESEESSTAADETNGEVCAPLEVPTVLSESNSYPDQLRALIEEPQVDAALAWGDQRSDGVDAEQAVSS